MKDKAFIDTNIFIYLYSADEPDKRKICIDSLTNYDCVSSTQALNELSSVFTRKWHLNSEDIKKAIGEISHFCDIDIITMKAINGALDIHQKYGFSYFDSLMLSSALLSQSKYIFTEDMKDRQKINGLEIINIFRV